MGHKIGSYGYMLILFLMNKLSEKISLIISRKFGKKAWNLQSSLHSIGTKLETQEKTPNSVKEMD